MHNQIITQKAASILKKYKTIRAIVAVLGYVAFLAVYILAYQNQNEITMILAMVIAVFLVQAVALVLFRKMISGTILDQLDAPLYSEIVRQGKIYVPSAIYQMQAEYYLGNYENVIAICNRKLAEKRVSKKYKYYYLAFLANCYFDIGNEEKTKESCDFFYQSVAKEKHNKRIIKQFSVFEFIQGYLKRDFDICNQYIHKHHSPIKLSQTAIEFKKARIALVRGEKDEAKIHFQKITKYAPLLNYAILSEKALQAIEEDYEYKDAFDKLTENEEFMIMDATKVAKVFSKIRMVAAIVFLVSVALWVIASVSSAISKYRDEQAHQEELAAYYQKIDALVETDYDGVEVLDCFSLKKDGEVVDSMFVCKTSNSILVCCTYVYPGDEAWYYDVKAEVTYDFFLQEGHTKKIYGYYCTTSDYYIYSSFYKNKADVPEDCYYSISFTVGENEFYYAITYIGDIILT